MPWRIWIRPHHQQTAVGAVRERSPDLLPIYDVFIAVSDGAASQSRQIRSGCRLAEEFAPLFLSLQDGREHPGFRFFSGVRDDRGADHCEPHVEEPRRVVLDELVDQDELMRGAKASTTILNRPRRCEPAFPPERLAPMRSGVLQRRIGVI